MLTALRSRLRRSSKADDSAKQEPVETVKAVQPKGEPRTRFGVWLSRPMTSFHLIIAVTGLLITLGLIMVLSASGVHSYDEGGSPWTIFGKQVLWTCVGLVAFYIALRTRISLMRRLALPAFAVTVVLIALVLVPGIGTYSNGSRGWFVVAALFAIWTVIFGIQYSFGVFFRSLQDAFGCSRGTISLAMTIQLVVFALVMVPAGWINDRFNLRIVRSTCSSMEASIMSCILSSRPSQVMPRELSPKKSRIGIRWSESLMPSLNPSPSPSRSAS